MKIIYEKGKFKYLMMKFLAVNEFYDYYMITLTIIKMKKEIKTYNFFLFIYNKLVRLYLQANVQEIVISFFIFLFLIIKSKSIFNILIFIFVYNRFCPICFIFIF